MRILTVSVVFVRGIWNSVNKSKHRDKHVEKSESQSKSEIDKEVPSPEAMPKTTSSKARRLRKLKLKSARRAEQPCNEDRTPEVEKRSGPELNTETEIGNSVNKETIEVIIEETIQVSDTLANETHFDQIISDQKGTFTHLADFDCNSKVKLSDVSDIKTKKSGKSKGFKLSKIFVTNPDSNLNKKEKLGNKTTILRCKNTEQELFGENVGKDRSANIIPAEITDASENIPKELLAKADAEYNSRDSRTEVIGCGLQNAEVSSEEKAVVDSSTSFTIAETEKYVDSTNTHCFENVTSSVLRNIKIDLVNSSDVTQLNNVENVLHTIEKSQRNILPPNTEIIDIVESSHQNDKAAKKCIVKENNDEQPSRPISIFVVPPDNIAQESETFEGDWESVSDFEGKSQIISSDDDDVRPETLIHLPSNNLETSAVLKDGRNGIIQVDDYELSVQDLYSPFMAPEEEARLRSFLETLNLSKPEEYDDTSSSRSFGDSSSTTSMPESSPIPQPPSNEIVIYRHIKTHSVAEPCYIPPKHQRLLDVITEENSDPSDTEKKSGNIRPWESPEIIRQNNEIEVIPDDWYGSDDEPETTSDEGGIDTSWGEGKKLDDVDGVEVVFLNSSSDDEVILRKTFEEKIYRTQVEQNKAELVVVHAAKTDDVKKTVNLQNVMKHNKNYNTDENKSGKNTMDEIMAILDSTYEINKDLFTNRPLVENIVNKPPKIGKTMKSIEGGVNIINKTSIGQNNLDYFDYKQIIKEPMTVDATVPEISLMLNDFDSGKYNTEQQMTTNENFEVKSVEFPTPQESVVAVTPPVLSRQNSSSSATSQSTARFNPNQSPLSSEAEDKSDSQYGKTKKVRKKLYNPQTLSHLSKEIVTGLPQGEFFLKKIGFWNSDIHETDDKEESCENLVNGKLISLPPSGISTRRSSYHELENIHCLQNNKNSYAKENSPPRPVLLKSPPPSTLTSPPPNDDPWLGLPTSSDRRLLVCLSPSQSKENNINTPKEATELLELHKKFLERRGYHESSKRNSIFSPKSDRSRSPDFSSPDLIRLEPYESKRAQVYTPELLIEAANLLALKEYRQCRLKSRAQSNSFKMPESTSVKINDNVLEKNDGLSEVTSSRTEINGESEGPDPNRSAGTSRLLALLQDRGSPCCSPNNTASSEMDRVDKSDDTKPERVHRYSGSYISEWLRMSENVTAVSEKTDVNENVINVKSAVKPDSKSILNNPDKGFVERRLFEADKYKISKKGDIAIMPEENDAHPPKKSERPKSVPSVGVPALSPSGGELFRELMYNEYMNKVAERTERRQQKVIKISSLPTSMESKAEPETEKNIQIAPMNKLELEFLDKVRERMNKLGINLDDEPSGGEGEEKNTAGEPLPKHLQEFIELTSESADDGQNAPTGESHVFS